MDSELAAQFADSTGYDIQTVMSRWNGSPDSMAEDLFQAKNQDTGHMEPLELFYPYQPKLLHAYFYGDNEILNVYKGRRIGVSFVFCIAILLDGLMHPDMFFPVVSRRKDQSQSRINDIRTLIESAAVDIPLEKDNKGEIILFNGSTFRAYTADPDGARGDDSARTVFVDEMAFIENQNEMLEAFMPFISLGTKGQMLQVSTPKVSNDKFMDTHRRGTSTGNDGVISVKQPTFANADDIDIEVSLFDQHIEPVRPDLNISAVESQRASDPQGFAQEFLCRPISDEYRFFSAQSIQDAQARGDGSEYIHGAYTQPQNGGLMVAGIDLASGSGNDDTTIAIFEHYSEKRYLRYHEVIDRSALELSGIADPDTGNPQHLIRRFRDLQMQMGINHFVIDTTGMGKFFDSNITDVLGRGVHKFDFNNKDDVMQMAGDLNAHLREDMVTLYPDEDLYDQLSSMVKEQKHDYQKPKLTGKEYSESGKDDIAMALIMGAYPSMLKANSSTSAHSKEFVEIEDGEGESNRITAGSGGHNSPATAAHVTYNSRSIARKTTSGRSYSQRHSRRSR